MKQPLALIGVGKWGRNYLSTLVDHPDAELAVIFSRQSEAEINAIAPHRALVVNSLEALIAHQNLFQGVIVATPPNNREEILNPLLQLAKPLLVEKPLTLELATSLAVIEQAEKNKILFIEDFIHLYKEPFLHLCELLRGQNNLVIHSCGENNGPVRNYSPLMDYGPHDVAMALTLFGDLPTSIRITDLDVTSLSQFGVSFELVFPRGNRAKITVGNAAQKKRRWFKVTAQEQVFVFDDVNEMPLTVNGDVVVVPQRASALSLVVSELSGTQKIYSQAFQYWLSRGVAQILHTVEGMLSEFSLKARC